MIDQFGLSIGDQGAVAATQLVLHLAAARELSDNEYGIFAITFAMFVVLGGAHTALLSEPMSVFGPTRYRLHLPEYLGVTRVLHIQVTLLLTAAFGLLGLIGMAGGFVNGRMVAAATAAIPLLLSFSFLRRSSYILDRVPTALLASVINAITICTGFAVLFWTNMISPEVLVLLLALGAAAASCLLLVALPSTIVGDPSVTKTAVIWRENWTYGRWILGGALTHWGGAGVYLLIVGFFLQMSDAGAFRAFYNLLAPVQQLHVALALPLLPWLATHTGGLRQAPVTSTEVRVAWLPITLLTAGYCAAVAAFGDSAASFLYGPHRYAAGSHILPLLSASVVAGAMSHVLTLSLRVRGYTVPVFWSKFGFFLVGISMGILLTDARGLEGAVWGLLASSVAEVGILAFSLVPSRSRS